MPTSPEWSFLASSLVKEVATFGGDVTGLVPEFVRELLVKRLAERDERPVSRTAHPSVLPVRPPDGYAFVVLFSVRTGVKS